MTEPRFLPADNPRIPQTDYPFRHCYPVQMRFTDIDMLGHLNNNVYLTFMDMAKIDYLTGIDPDCMSINNIRVVVVHIDCDFLHPSYFGEQLEVWSTITSIGHRSFNLEQRIINSVTGQTKCIGRTVMAGFDPASATGAPIDPEWIAAAEKFEGRKLQKAK